MKKNIITIIVGVIIASTSGYLYTEYRAEKNKKNLVNNARRLNKKIYSLISYLGGESEYKQSQMITKILSGNSQVAAIITTGKGGLLKKIGKGKNFIESDNAIEFIVEQIGKSEFQGEHTEQGVLLKGAPLRGEYYLFPHGDTREGISILISPQIANSIRTEIILESILLISLILTCTSLVYMILRKRESSDKVEEQREIKIDLTMGRTKKESSKPPTEIQSETKKEIEVIEIKEEKPLSTKMEEPPMEQPKEENQVKEKEGEAQCEENAIDEKELIFVRSSESNVVKTDMEAKNPEKKRETEETFNSRVMELFREITEELPTDSIMLYMRKMENRLTKTYELRGRTLLKIDSSIIDSIEIDELNEAEKSGAKITHNGQIIKLPVMKENSLLGLVEIYLSESILNVNLDNLRTKLKGFALATGDYLTVNRVIFDEPTGIYSETYFKMKMDEINYKKSGEGYAIITMDIFNDRNLSVEEKNLVIKIMNKELSNAADCTNLYRRGDKISIIVEHDDKSILEEMGINLVNTARKFRIKLSEKILSLNPVVEITINNSREQSPLNIEEEIHGSQEVTPGSFGSQEVHSEEAEPRDELRERESEQSEPQEIQEKTVTEEYQEYGAVKSEEEESNRSEEVSQSQRNTMEGDESREITEAEARRGEDSYQAAEPHENHG